VKTSLAVALREPRKNCEEEKQSETRPENGTDSARRSLGFTGTPYLIYLAACHKFQDKENPCPELIALCVACHARHDWKHKQAMQQAYLEQLKHLQLLIQKGIVTIQTLY
jgi:hypothetical protein